MIEYVQGDAAKDPKEGIIVHVVNDVGAWGAGFSGALSKRSKLPENRYRNTRTYRLGLVQFVDIGGGVTVANMIAQRGLPARGNWLPLSYIALAECLGHLAAAILKEDTVHMPRIGAGLARGNWNVIEALVNDAFRGRMVMVYDLLI